MNYKILLFILISIFISGCEQNLNKSKNININVPKKYSNSGFALIYDESLDKIKKLMIDL